MSKGLASLRRWQKCQRRVAGVALKAALRATPKALRGEKKSELSRAANVLASVACSKSSGRKQGRRIPRSMRTHMESIPRRHRGKGTPGPSYFNRNQHIPGFRPYHPPAREEPRFNPEVSY